jgi:hypothetical protein
VYSALDDTKDDDGKPTSSSAKINESKRARTMLGMWVRSAGRQSQAVHAVRRGFSLSTERAREGALQHLEARRVEGWDARRLHALTHDAHQIHPFTPPAFSVVYGEGLLPGNWENWSGIGKAAFEAERAGSLVE